jgi:hypothetical protein
VSFDRRLTKNWCDVAPELEESRKTGGTVVTHTQSTTTELSAAGTRDIVLEKTGSTIVGESLAEFDNGDQESSLGKRLANLAESADLLGRGGNTTKTVLFLIVGYANGSARATATLLLNDLLLVVDMNIGANIVAVRRCAEKVWLVVCLSLHVHQLLGPFESQP